MDKIKNRETEMRNVYHLLPQLNNNDNARLFTIRGPEEGLHEPPSPMYL